jgi:hypothetical protein
MVVMQPPGGSAREYQLQQSMHGLRLVAGCLASYDLLTMVTEAGWRVARADEADRVLLERTGVSVPASSPAAERRPAPAIARTA